MKVKRVMQNDLYQNAERESNPVLRAPNPM